MREPHLVLYSLSLTIVFPSQIKRMFALADKDKDGKLSVAEWEQMLVQAGAPADKSVHFYFREKLCYYRLFL